uniref:EB domain-containing protein n=1 Tax=Globodera rostochiensis TaxID=31243 RepID=A0A914ID74_GLORO
MPSLADQQKPYSDSLRHIGRMPHPPPSVQRFLLCRCPFPSFCCTSTVRRPFLLPSMRRFALPFFPLLFLFVPSGIGQYYGSNFLSALRGYGTDLCRFVSCPLGQYCINGVCQVNSVASGLYGGGYGSALYGGVGAGAGGSLGLYGAANKLCADTVDCYSGQVCLAGRCSFQSGGYSTGGLGPAGYGVGYGGNGIGYGGAYGLGMGTDLASSSLYSPYGYGGGGYSPFASLANRPSGLLSCTLMQDCPNGQICVNGFCSESNVAYGGSQMLKTPPNCASGAICPVGYYCMGGLCAKDLLSQTSTCSLGFVCPPAQSCQFGRCMPSTSSLMYGKKRKK